MRFLRLGDLNEIQFLAARAVMDVTQDYIAEMVNTMKGFFKKVRIEAMELISFRVETRTKEAVISTASMIKILYMSKPKREI